MVEEPHGSRVLWQPLRLEARVFEDSNGQWGARPGAIVWYATEKKHSTKLDICLSIDTGETRSSYEGIVEWLETKARRAVKESFGLDEQESNKVAIVSEVKIER